MRSRRRQYGLVAAIVEGLATLAVCVAPNATASTNAAVLNWTGLHDPYGVPIGDFYLSIASLPEQMATPVTDNSGTNTNPMAIFGWMLHSLKALATYFTTAQFMVAEAGIFVGIIAVALWLMKITMSTYWLTVIGQIAHAITWAVVYVVAGITFMSPDTVAGALHEGAGLGLMSLAVVVGIFRGYLMVKRGESGRGWTRVAMAITMPAISVAIFADPAGMMYGKDGLLAFGRRLGFSVAEAAHPYQGANTPAQMSSMTSSLILHTVREPLQVWNFGHVVDRIGTCRDQLSAAYRSGAAEGPINAMKRCGDHAAVTYAQHLDGTNVFTGLAYVTAAFLLGLFMVLSGWAVLKVSIKAIKPTVKLLVALWAAALSEEAEQHAKSTVWEFFKPVGEMAVFVVFVSVIGVAVEQLVSRPLPAELGGNDSFAHVVMMGGAAAAALYLLRELKGEIHGHPYLMGSLVRRTGNVAIGMALSAGLGVAGSAGLKGLGAAGKRLLRFGQQAPWERFDAASDDALQAHGEPQPGFNPVMDASDISAAPVDPGGSTQASYTSSSIDPVVGHDPQSGQPMTGKDWPRLDYPTRAAANAAAAAIGNGAYSYKSKAGVWHLGRDRLDDSGNTVQEGPLYGPEMPAMTENEQPTQARELGGHDEHEPPPEPPDHDHEPPPEIEPATES